MKRIACLLVACLPILLSVIQGAETGETPPAAPTKKVFAHCVGCWPVGSGALAWSKLQDEPRLRHDRDDDPKRLPDREAETMRRGGHVRNWDLVPYGTKLSPEESADLEIRRALRIGLDGIAVDAWCGGEHGKQTLDALFKAAEAKDYPFEATICIDPTCGGTIVEDVKYLLEKHGKSPKLARRNGKPLIFGYMSVWPAFEYLKRKMPGKTDAEYARLRASPEGWEIMGEAFKDAEKQIGHPVFWHFCADAFFHGVDRKLFQADALVQAAGVLAKHVSAVGGFVNEWGENQAAAASAVKGAGAEWSAPVGWYQKENIPYENYAGKGLDWMCGQWAAARDQGASLIQITTWNDYGENTNIAPAYNTRYTLFDLTGFFIQWWKTGREPKPDHDRVYIVSRKYPAEVKVFPFKQGPYLEGALEVVTILPQKATVRLPGRNAEYEAPEGFSRRQFPVTPGPVVVELLRGTQAVLTLESPEPITDRPFREDNSMVCYSTEFNRHWKADFGDTPPLLWSEYGDANKNGLPNWFEMYWFGKFGDMSTASSCPDPNAKTPSGKTLRECYLERVDPTKPVPQYADLPADGLLAWYRADKGVVADDGGLVSAWQDQGPNKLDLVAKTAAEKPRLLKEVWNQRPAIELDGVRNSMLCMQVPDREYRSLTIIAVGAARAKDQVCRNQEGINNRLISIPTTAKADYDGGGVIGVSGIGWPAGDVAVFRREFEPKDRPACVALGFMATPGHFDNRGWNFKGKVAEILIYSPALDAAGTRKAVSVLKARYGL
ncbi:MAG: endo-1,3-alpha-glucanase family glycosylhydrolase [Planctomycetota bacterium]